MLIAIIIYSLIFGMRYGVGDDFISYLNIYTNPNGVDAQNSLKRWEPIFVIINSVFQRFNFHSSAFFTFWAFIPLLCVFYSNRYNKYIYPYLAFTFMIGGEFLSFSNGLRQIAAFGFFCLSITCLWERKYLLFIGWVVLAYLCHKSAIMLLILLPFYYKKTSYFNNLGLQIVLMASSIVFMNISIVQSLMLKLNGLISFLEYDYYLNGGDDLTSNVRIGLGFYINLLIDFLIVIFSKKTKTYFNNTFFPILYDLFFLGVLMKYMFISVQLVGRVNYYFYGFEFVVAAFTLYYLVKKNNALATYTLLGLFLARYIAILYRMEENTALFKFWWDVRYM